MHYLTYQVIVRPLRQLVPPYLLAGRWIVVLVCYLDDSGKDPQNPITTLAGYIARDTAWEAFEREREPMPHVPDTVPGKRVTDAGACTEGRGQPSNIRGGSRMQESCP